MKEEWYNSNIGIFAITTEYRKKWLSHLEKKKKVMVIFPGGSFIMNPSGWWYLPKGAVITKEKPPSILGPPCDTVGNVQPMKYLCQKIETESDPASCGTTSWKVVCTLHIHPFLPNGGNAKGKPPQIIRSTWKPPNGGGGARGRVKRGGVNARR